MKKAFIMAALLALGMSATAAAENPFSDLPSGHWAYGAVAKLAAEGVIDGYPDGTFKGNKTMTRYEMAQIVAKALAKGAIGSDDKLVTEFADELDTLGVRVAKLEKNADNVKITGNIRISYYDSNGSAFKGVKDKSASQVRTRLFFTGEVNDNWHYTSMLENDQYFQGRNESGEGTTDFQRMYLTGKIGAVDVQAGRFEGYYGDGNIYDWRVDAVQAKVPVNTHLSLTGVYGKMANLSEFGKIPEGRGHSLGDKYWTGILDGNWGNWSVSAGYLKATDLQWMGLTGDGRIWSLGANYTAGKWKIGGIYMDGDGDSISAASKAKFKHTENNGYVLNLSYAGATANRPGSWGLFAKYFNQGAPTALAQTAGAYLTSFPGSGQGFRGYELGGNLTLAKNMVAELQYYDLKGKEDNAKARWLWSQLVVTF